MLKKLLIVTGLFVFSTFTFAQERSLDLVVRKVANPVTTEVATSVSELPSADANNSAQSQGQIMLNAYEQSITAGLEQIGKSPNVFWEKVREKGLEQKQELEFLSPVFLKVALSSVPSTPESTTELYQFRYEMDFEKLRVFYDEVVRSIPDVAEKTFYILADIRLHSDMKWEDVGVNKAENFTGVIIESWRKWASDNFKNFTNYVILTDDLDTNALPNISSESVTLKWNSLLKKSEVFQDRKSARYELSGQYVLVNTKSGQNLLAFDFPLQKNEVSLIDNKELSSNLASQIFNLLNSQLVKVRSALELNNASSALKIHEFSITGQHGLFDITQINSFLTTRFRSINLTSELKTFSSQGSTISIKSTVELDTLVKMFAELGENNSLNEQKLLVFSPENRSFAIIPKTTDN